MIRIYFGNPGCGKTTLACRNAYKIIRRYKRTKKTKYNHIYANFDNKLTKFSDMVGLGDWTFPPHSYIIVDEAGIQYNNRKFKTMSQSLIQWFKLHRHYKCDIDFISQSWEDCDITIRRLADELWYVRKLGPFTLLRKVYKTVEIDENTHQIIDGYKFGKLLPQLLPFPFHRTHFKIFLRKPYYKYFDSYSTPDTPIVK